MVEVESILSIITYSLIFILLILAIVLVIRLIKTMGDIDKVVKDVEDKSSKLDGVFNAVEGATDFFGSFGDKAIAFITGSIMKKMKKSKEKGKNENE